MTDRILRPLGHIVRLQLQLSNLKLGEKPNRWYDPSPLLAVDALTLTPDGTLVRTEAGGAVLDIHHGHHPATRNNGTNDISVGFTSHYFAMRAQFGSHLTDGIAGENILVDYSAPIHAADLASGLAIRLAAGGELVWLRGVRVMPPCVEFSTFAGRSSEPETLKAALQFLNEGMRGFCGRLQSAGALTISVGDQVLVGAAVQQPAHGQAR